MEREMLAFCRAQAGMKSAGNEQQDGAGAGAGAGADDLGIVEAMRMPVETWMSDN
jgi:hypothetical protein